MLNEVINWGVKPNIITGDCWYSSVKNLKFLKEQRTSHGAHFTSLPVSSKLGIMIGIAANRQVWGESG